MSNLCVSVSCAAPAGSIATHSASVKLQWYAHTRTSKAHFSSQHAAKQAANLFDKTNLHGFTLTAKFQQPSRIDHRTSSFSVWIAGINGTVTQGDLKRFLLERVAAGNVFEFEGHDKLCHCRDSSGHRSLQLHPTQSLGVT